ncbi:riboflavin biosynthesis protein RibF [Ligilactobacillus cholophilus]|uniref:riboflavin biosynthesis protein RibF n=1 Tax=Ligilactobacillus cholophilus TaxID=3050131 RepID=UPI0025AF68F5|nr:riboflavin biosynthesis protein RibF [Ligilactobacillus cholophilus]
MQVIHISEPIDYSKIENQNIVLAMGFFDGVHQGHQAVLSEAKKQAVKSNLKLAVMTFDCYPKMFFKKIKPDDVNYLTTVEKRISLFEKYGADIVYIAHFDKNLAKLSPQDFVDKYMVGLHAKILVAGFDYTYGKREIANMQTLPQYAQNRFKVIEVSKKTMRNEKIGTTKIKRLLNEGKIEEINCLLGYKFNFDGEVVHGKARGRTLGFPTLNIKPFKQQCIPGIGVYAVKVKYDNRWYEGMASVSHNETFGDNPLTIEINVFDFDQMIYGEQVEIEWDKYLRAPIKFESVDELIEQLNEDKKVTKMYFENN